MQLPSNVADQLLTLLIAKARARHDKGVEENPGMDFEQFMKGVEAAGGLSVRLVAEGVPFNHVGMAFDYYARAIKYMIDEAEKLKDMPVKGHA